MSSNASTPLPPHRKGPAPRPPRITINVPPAYAASIGTSQYTMPSASTIPGGAPMWPNYGNPFMYSQKAGEFMSKQFDGFMSTAKSGLSFGEKSVFWFYEKLSKWSKQWFTHAFLFLIVVIYSFVGAVIFKAVEGSAEEDVTVDIHDYKYDLAKKLRDHLRNQEIYIHHKDEVQFDTETIKIMEEYVDGLGQFDEFSKWTMWNAVLYCGTIYTTIGYGNISAKTTLGQILTIIYAIIGIPMFLILLADFGKLFTRGIKFLWAYVRRLYYTGSCRKVRKHSQVREVMRGFNVAYDYAIRRPSQFIRNIDMTEKGEEEEEETQANNKNPGDGVAPTASPETPHSFSTHLPGESITTTPTTPYPETYEIDEEFNLPVSVATTILLLYIFIGALAVYIIQKTKNEEQHWTYFESFYFVFISMSTIGFGDYLPQDSIFMVCSIVYLVFGLALTSMCINVVQVKLSDSFRQASAKIGATIGLKMAAEEEARSSLNQTPVELASVHSGPRLENIPEDDYEHNHVSPRPTPTPSPYIYNNNNEDTPPPLLPRKSAMKQDKRNYL